MTRLLLSVVLPTAIVILGMPIAAALARRVGLVDRPDRRRKLHLQSVPLAGGGMILLAVLAAHLLIAPGLGESDPASPLTAPGVFLPLFALFGVGLIDDRFRMPGRLKLLAQLAVAIALIGGGFHIQAVKLFGWEIHAGLFALPLTLLWLIGSANSVNLLDGMDGVVGTIGLLIAATVAAVAFGHGQIGTGLSALILCGALAGFLVFNLPGASVFMGDAGSLTLGLTLGILVLGLESADGRAVLGVLAVAVMMLPICDSCAAFTRRYLTGQSIFATDRGHLHHRLRQAGMSGRQVLALLACLNLLLGASVVGWAVNGSYVPVAVAIVAVAGVLVLGRLFGHSELKLLARRIAHLLRIPAHTRARLGRVARVHLQGTSQCWEEIWKGLLTQVSTLRPRSLTFSISAPAIHEAYHARWDGPPSSGEFPSDWRIQMPVRLDEQVIGWLEVVAEFCPVTGPHAMTSVSGLVERIEHQIAQRISLPAPLTDAVLEVIEEPRPGVSHPRRPKAPGWTAPLVAAGAQGE